MLKKCLAKFMFWINCARVYSLPITVLNWLVIFVYSLKSGGNFILGICALFGIGFVHLATNLIDDYFDYKILIKDESFMASAQNCKCLYLKNNQASLKELRFVILFFLLIAAFVGILLFFFSGWYVAILALFGLIVALTYQKFSRCGLGELSVFFAYGPLLYEGVYYVMTSSFSLEVLLLSFACAFFTNTILYVHMLMDIDGDECSHKTTLCRKFKTKTSALNFVLVFYLLAYILIILLACLLSNYFYLLPLITILQVCDLYRSLSIYNSDKTIMPKVRFWHKPLDNWKNIENTEDATFYFHFYYARNIVTLFMLLACLAIIL